MDEMIYLSVFNFQSKHADMCKFSRPAVMNICIMINIARYEAKLAVSHTGVTDSTTRIASDVVTYSIVLCHCPMRL